MHTLTKQLCRLYVSVTTKHSCWAVVSFTSSLTLTALSVSKHVHDNKCNGKISRKQGSQMVGYRKYVVMKSHRTKLNFFPSGILPTSILSSKSLSAMIQFSWIPPSWILSSATLIYFMWLCPLLSTWFETGMGLLLSLFVCACVCMCVCACVHVRACMRAHTRVCVCLWERETETERERETERDRQI